MPPDFFETAMKAIVVFGAGSVVLLIIGIGVKSAFFRTPKLPPAMEPDELRAIQDRLQTTEAKVFELEERLDFAERLLTEARAKGQLPKP